MSHSSTQRLPVLRRPALAIAGGLAGYALNRYGGVEMEGGVPLEFGGCASLMVAVLIGPLWGGLAGALAFAGSIGPWSHSAGVYLFAGEALCIGWCNRHRPYSVLSVGTAYWVLVGLPLAALHLLCLTRLPAPLHWITLGVMPISGLLADFFVDLLAAIPGWRKLLARQHPGGIQEPTLREIFRRRFGGISIVVLLIIAVISGHAYNQRSHAAAAREMATTARHLGLQMESYLTMHRLVIESEARQLSVERDGPGAAVATDFGTILQTYPGFITMLLADERGTVVAAAPGTRPDGRPAAGPGNSVADRGYFRQALASGRSYVSGVFQGKFFGNDIIVAISAPFTDAAGHRWVLEGSLRLEELVRNVARPEYLKGFDIVLTDSEDRVVFAQGFPGLVALQVFSGPGAPDGQAQAGPFLYDQADQSGKRPVRYHAAWQSVPGYNWRICLRQQLWEEIGNITLFYEYILAGAVLASLLILGVSHLTARELTMALQQLAETTEAIGQRGLLPRETKPMSAPAEIIRISQDVQLAAGRIGAVNQQLAGINATQEATNRELNELTVHLEERVRQRTGELEKARKMADSANHAKSEFLATMSHELRTPLHVILGMAEILADGSLGPLAPKQTASLRSIDESGRHLLELINDILDLSKIEAGRLELERHTVSLKSVCEASLRLVHAQAGRKRQTVEFEFQLSRPRANVDGRRLKQVFLNLLANAVKFTPEHGRLGLQVMDSPDGSHMHFVVWDHGVGISPADQARLFQPFIQARSRLQRDHGGTGLGLSLARRMTELHGGTLSLVSEVGQGSSFTVSIPYPENVSDPAHSPERGGQTAATAAGEEGPLFGPMPPRVLIAEDNLINLQLLESYLQLHGCLTIHAANGQIAVAAAEKDMPDIILMDINMPEMNGLDATRRIRANARTTGIPILALTALAMEEDKARGYAADVDGYLTKPVNLRQLGEEMKRVLGLRRNAST